MNIWRYCPTCYTVGRTQQVRCTHCKLAPRLLAIPASTEALESAYRIGGPDAVEELVVALVAGPEAVEALVAKRHEAIREMWEADIYTQLKIKRPGH